MEKACTKANKIEQSVVMLIKFYMHMLSKITKYD